MFCLQCGKEIGDITKNRICPYCGFEQYEEPSKEIMSMLKRINCTELNNITSRKSNKKNDEINQWYDMGLF